jgi:hypothetical protein
MLRKGMIVRWNGRGAGLYRIERVYQAGEVRIESLAYPGVFNLVGWGSVTVVRNAA